MRIIYIAGPYRGTTPWQVELNIHRARELGVMLAIGTDSHIAGQLKLMRFGIGIARRGWCEPKHILNCLSLEKVLAFFKR